MLVSGTQLSCPISISAKTKMSISVGLYMFFSPVKLYVLQEVLNGGQALMMAQDEKDSANCNKEMENVL